jgi:DNA replication and repair protein RecF
LAEATRLVRISARGYRNLIDAEVDVDAQFVVFHGENAQGKTNWLEAIYNLATLKSFRTRSVREQIRWGSDAAVLGATLRRGQVLRHYRVALDPEGRRGTVDGKTPGALVDYFKDIRAMVFAPESLDTVKGGPEARRRFLDRAAFTLKPQFLVLAREHRKLLAQKARLLKGNGPDPLWLDTLDAQLAQAGARLVARRREVLDLLKGPFQKHHGAIAGYGEATLEYRTALVGDDVAALAQSYAALLDERRPEELRRGMNVVGPQRDEMTVRIDGRAARTFGSQGQVRSVVLALTLAVLDLPSPVRPLLLLDDLSSELDKLRTGRLVERLRACGVQVFVSTTDPSLVDALPSKDVLRLKVCQGRISLQS